MTVPDWSNGIKSAEPVLKDLPIERATVTASKKKEKARLLTDSQRQPAHVAQRHRGPNAVVAPLHPT